MKYLILLLLPLTLFAYDSNEEIDALQSKDFLQELVRSADKTCRSNFAPEAERIYANLEMVSYKRKNCEGKGLIDQLSDCDDVDYSCEKPSQSAIDAEFVKLKDKFKDDLAKRQEKEAKKAEKEALKEKLKTEDLKLDELNKILRE